MSSRQKLIEENIRRANNPESSAPSPKASVGKSAASVSVVQSHQSVMGGNVAVYSRLESIAFQGSRLLASMTDGSMRGDIAHIRIWKRSGEAPQSQTAIPATWAPQADRFSDLSKELNQKILDLSSETDFFGLLGPDAPKYQLNEYDWGSFETNPIYLDFRTPSALSLGVLKDRQNNIGNVTPSPQRPTPGTGLVSPNVFGTPIPIQTPFSRFPIQTPFSGFLNQFRPSPFFRSPTLFGSTAYIPTQPLGNVFSANPNGLLNILTSAAIGAGLGAVGFRSSFPSFLTGFRLPPPINVSRGNAPPRSSSVSPPGEMVWQFLFNPSELELEAGPEFKGAETWAVSDKANSGQPLHWSHNKNAQLKFNSVLLNGFVFGRKVEELEQGLFELFMARDGAGQHGPHVLEFIWGKKVFGPCVIKNVVVKEKMWDEGELVNAELSFTLEQVPEWTINDGAYVDIARPGRMPLQEELAPNLGQTAGAGTDGAVGTDGAASQPEPQPQPPGGGSNSGQKGQTPNTPPPSANERRCQRAYYYAGRFAPFITRINNQGPIFSTRNDTRRIVSGFLVDYRSATQELGPDFSPTERATEIYKRTEDILNPNRPEGRLDGRQIKGYINGYIKEAIDRAKGIYDNRSKCPNTAGSTAQPNSPRLANPTNL
jgi:hypothetical protein